jgi:hypothetical protein
MIVRIALLLVSIPLLVHGADGLYHGLRSRTQAAVPCETFAHDRPSSRWVRITGCDVDYLRAGVRESGGRVTEFFLPLTPPLAPANQPVSLVVSTKEASVLALAEEALSGRAATNQDDFLVAMLQVVTAMGAAREVEGMTRSPLEMLRSRGALDAIAAPRADDIVVLDLYRRPNLLLPAIELVLATIILVFLLGLSLKWRRRSAASADLEAAADTAAPPAISAARTQATPEFRRLMLVNLPPHAPPSALEQATPLGSQASVRAALGQVLPGITFNDHGLGHFNRADHTILMDLGSDPQVYTATVDVTGEAAPEALRRLITETGWRAYAPRLGRFITAADLKS